jgi:monoamine oxidase
MHLMPGIPNNLPREYTAAMAQGGRGKLLKIGLQMNERFWEKEHIYGGITWTNQEVEQIWYPAHGIHGNKGVMLGAYIFNERTNDLMARMTPAERIELAIQNGERIHPDYRRHVETGVTVAWHRMNYLMGCTTQWQSEDARRDAFPGAAAAGRPALHDGRPDQLSPGLAGGRHQLRAPGAWPTWTAGSALELAAGASANA